MSKKKTTAANPVEELQPATVPFTRKDLVALEETVSFLGALWDMSRALIKNGKNGKISGGSLEALIAPALDSAERLRDDLRHGFEPGGAQ
jgi:hypothetical protein